MKMAKLDYKKYTNVITKSLKKSENFSEERVAKKADVRDSQESGSRRNAENNLPDSRNAAENKLPDYKVYKLSAREKVLCIMATLLAGALISLLFYHSVFPTVIFVFAVPFTLKAFNKMLCERRKEKLTLQFRDGMSAYASAIRAGYSPENAISEARGELARIYGNEAMLVKEFSAIRRKLSLGAALENALLDLAERSGIEEIRDMAEVFAIAKRSGGSLPTILRDSVYMLEEKSRLKEEIKTLMTAKKLEQRIMCIMPAGILFYINITGEEFVKPLYEGLTGRLVMTGAILIYAGAILLGEKMMKVKL